MNWLRLPGLEADAAELVYEDGRLVEVLVPVRPVATDYPVCCLAQKLVKNGTKAVRYRDRRLEAAPTWLVVKKQRMKCLSCGKTLYQHVPSMDEHHYITERLRDDLRLSAANRDFRDAVRMHAVEETLVRRVFRRYADEKLLNYRFEAPRVLGIDENHLFGAARGVVLNVETSQLLDMYEGCSHLHVRRGMTARMVHREKVEVWCQDMAAGYKKVARELFPKAQIVIDKFHVVAKAGLIWRNIRLRETKTLPPELRKMMPGIINMFNQRWEKMKPSTQDRVAEILAHSDVLKAAWTIKESFHYFYEKPNRAEAEATYDNWVKDVHRFDQYGEWRSLMNMVAAHREHIFNYFDHRFTSAKVERMNRSIADINRDANGLDFVSLRAKALMRHGILVPDGDYTFYCIDLSKPPPADPYPRPANIISTRNAG